jgi:hypothetical protein
MSPNNNRIVKKLLSYLAYSQNLTKSSCGWFNSVIAHKSEYVLVGSHKCERVLLNPRHSPNPLISYHALVFYHKPKTKVGTSVEHVYCF